MKNRVIAILSGVFFFTVTQAQNNTAAFVEVIVEDTLKVSPEETQYFIQIKSNINYQNFQSKKSASGMPDFDTTEAAESNRKVIRFISKYSIDTLESFFKPAEIEKLQIQSVYKKYILKFTSEPTLKEFLKLCEELKNIENSVLHKKHSRLKDFEEILYKRIIYVANERAAILASTSKRGLGRIIQVRELTDENNNSFWTAYPPLSMLFSTNSEYQIIIRKKIKVRYELY